MGTTGNNDQPSIKRVHVYTRKHNAHAWKYEHTSLYDAALIARDVNEGFTVATLLVPDTFEAFPWLDSWQTQSDFDL
jgi:hypothetical protein